jgi:HK97 family phage major capsid protein
MFASALAAGVWVASPTLIPQLATMVDTGNHIIWQPNAREGIPGTLLGLPLLFNERSPVLGTKGDLILANFQYYLIKDGFGVALAASPHRKFEFNITIIKAFWNVDGKPWLTAPITLEDGATQMSPFVVLDVPGI